MLVLEELESARARGAHILAEMVGYGMSADAFHVTAPPADGDGAFRVMRNSMRDARIEPGQVDYINASSRRTTASFASKSATGSRGRFRTPSRSAS